MAEALSANTRAILLLTAPLITGRRGTVSDVLTPAEYGKLARRLVELGATPADLATHEAGRLLADCKGVIDPARLEHLLARGFLLSQAIERWHARAIWVVSRADPAYPQRLKARLREDSPAVIYGCGNREILASGSLAVVGSRNADDALIEYTREVGRLAASAGRTVVSGGARGIDQAAMHGALRAGGRVAGVLADSLEKAAMQREYRNRVMNDQLVLISPYDPGAAFNIGHAMQRNKLIYALADAALVVSAERKKGGTWAGAIEQLEKLRFVPVFVRTGGASSSGLDALVTKGALPWPEPDDVVGLNAVLARPVVERGLSPAQKQLSFESPHDSVGIVREVEIPAYGSSATSPPATQRPKLSAADELFETVRSLVLRIVREPMNATGIAGDLGVTEPQARKWLDRLVREGTLKKSDRPVRYSVRQSSLFEGEVKAGSRADAGTDGTGQ